MEHHVINGSRKKETSSEPSISTVSLAVLAASVASALLTRAVANLDLPLFLDSIGTAIVALCFGPLPGVMTGLLSNLIAEAVHGFPGSHWPFAVVNMTTGLILGVMARRMDFYRGTVIAGAVLAVTLANALLGALIVTLLFGGITAQGVDYLVSALVLSGQNIFSAAFLARLPINFIDKSIAVLIGVGVMRWYGRRQESLKTRLV